MTTKNKVYEVVVEFKRIETVTICVAAASKEEALAKAKQFDYADIDFDHQDGGVEYFWEDADVIET